MSITTTTLCVGQVVWSAAGHDKDRFYMVVNLEKDAVWIADGKRRTLASPKRKNPIHLRKTNTVLDPDAVTTDKKLRQALAGFNHPTPDAPPANKEGGTKLV